MKKWLKEDYLQLVAALIMVVNLATMCFLI